MSVKDVYLQYVFNHISLKCEVSIIKENKHVEDEGSIHKKFLCERSSYK